MIKLIVGSRGAGKTKQLVDLINESVKTNEGSVVCIEKGMQLTYDLDHKCRLIGIDEYKVEGYPMLFGFIAGILAGNYDINEIYLDGILKVGNQDMEGLGQFLTDIEGLAPHIRFTVTVSAEQSDLPENAKKYL